jgi:hypothetical protein
MSVSRHPVALRLEQQVGEGTRLLATVMALPLVDGIFPALVLAGALTYPFGILEAGLLVFGGSATVAIILAEMDGDRRQQVRAILALAVVLLPLAALEAAVAPTIESVLNMAVFQRFAGLVILAVAAKTASSKVGDYLPRPAVIVGLGMLASVQPAGAELVVRADPGLIARAVATAGVGVTFALLVALAAPRLRGAVDLDRFRFGSAVALGMLALSVLKLMPTEAPVALGVLVVTAVFAYDPGADDFAVPDASEADPGPTGNPAPGDRADAEASESGAAFSEGDADVEDEGSSYGYPGEEDSRAPWL